MDHDDEAYQAFILWWESQDRCVADVRAFLAGWKLSRQSITCRESRMEQQNGPPLKLGAAHK
jgi:hypothetical protein